MVKKLFARISGPVRGLHQAAYLLAALTLASKILALMRDRTFADSFGAGPTLDMYYAAFRVPDLVFALVASLVSAYVIIPRITGASREDVRRLLSESASFLFLVGGGFCLVLAVFMPAFLSLIYPDLAGADSSGQFVLLARLLLIKPILLGLSGVLASVTQVHRRFLLFPLWGLSGIGVGVIIGAVAYVMVNVPVLLETGVFPRFVLPRLRTMLPV